MILVVGATGVLGLEICRVLRETGAPVRALVRTGSAKAGDLKALGVETATGDLKDPASLRSACQGVDVVITTATAITHRRTGDTLDTVDRKGNLALLDAARSAGVRRFVYVSVSPTFPPNCALIRNKRLVEREVRGSGLEWVILQPPAFQEIWLSPIMGWDFPGGKGQVFGTGERPVAFVAIPDVARVAAEAALRNELANRDIPFGGPEALSPNAVARIAEELAGRPFEVKRVKLGPLKIMRVVLAPFAPIPASLISLGITVGTHGDVPNTGDLWRTIGHTPRKVRDYVAKAVAGAH